MWRESAAVLLLGAATTACYHGAADGGVDASESGDATRADGTSDDGDDGPVPGDGAGPMPLRRLTRLEYDNTVRDLLGDDTRPADALPGESIGSSGFATAGIVSTVDARGLMEVAEAVAARATEDLPGLMSCDPLVDEEACVQTFVESFAKRAYRRALEPGELEGLLALYDVARMDLDEDVAGGVRLVLRAVLQSPQFLYRWELGTSDPQISGELVALTDHEVASRLSYFLWSSMPDAELFAAADAGDLAGRDEIEAHARRMLADPKAVATIDTFHEQWLGLTNLPDIVKSPEAYPSFDEALRASMAASTTAFVRWAILESDGRLETLLTSNMGFVDEALAALYGIEGVDGATLQGPVALPADQRAGILTSAGYLAVHANAFEGSPMARGKHVREKLILCASIPPPPMDVELPDLPPPDPNVPIRERYEAHGLVEPCVSCHTLMDPIGFGLGNFDAVGAWTTVDGGKPVDATGVVTSLDGVDAPFDGPVELARLLADSPAVRDCVARQWFRFAFGRGEGPGDDASLMTAQAAFVASDYDVRELLVALALTQSFRFRAAAEGEVLP